MEDALGSVACTQRPAKRPAGGGIGWTLGLWTPAAERSNSLQKDDNLNTCKTSYDNASSCGGGS